MISNDNIAIKNQGLDTGAGNEGSDLVALWRIVQRHWKSIAAVTGVVTLGALLPAISYRTVPQYASEMMMLLYRESSVPDVTSLEGVQESGPSSNLATEITVLQSQSLISQALTNETLAEEEELDVQAVINNLSIAQPGGSNILIISYTAETPEQAQAVLTALGETYIAYSLERQKSEATEAIQLVNAKLPEARAALNRSASDLREFREANKINDPDALATAMGGQQQDLQVRYQDVKIALEQALSEYESLEQQLIDAGQKPQLALLYATLSQDPIYRGLMDKLTEVQAQYSVNRSRFFDNAPEVQDDAAQREFLVQEMRNRASQVLGNAAGLIDVETTPGYTQNSTIGSLAERLLATQTELDVLESEWQGLDAAIADLDQGFQRVPQLQQEYFELQSDFESRAETVDYLVGTLQDLEIAEAQDIAPWEILQPPTEPQAVADPNAPSLPRNLVLGVFGGVLLGSSLALVRDRFDQRLKTLQDVKTVTRLPLLGGVPELPYAPGTNPALMSQGNSLGEQELAYGEALRVIATEISHLGARHALKTLVVTSATPGEGKSTLTYHLGQALGDLGLRVLVLDADLRHPRLHQLAGLTNELGLNDLLNQGLQWSQTVHRGGAGQPDLLTAGSKTTNPAGVLKSGRMRKLLEDLRQAYDVVLIDTPPMLGLADTQVLSHQVDGVLLVVGVEQVPRQAVGQVMETLRQDGCNVVGAVANRLSQEHGFPYGGYYPPPFIEEIEAPGLNGRIEAGSG